MIEVVLVVLIMGILTAVAAQKWGGALEQSRFDATRAEMDQIASAIAGNPALVANGMRSDFGYVGDVGGLPPNLDALVTNPGDYITWDGPYLQNDFTQNPNDFKQDAWGIEYSYTGGVAISSTGSGSTVTKTFASAGSDLTANTIAGSVTDGLDNAPGDSAASVSIEVTYPDGAGAMAHAVIQPGAGGSFTFTNMIPIGNHVINAIYQTDTLSRYVSVLPKSTAYVNFRFPGDLWGVRGSRAESSNRPRAEINKSTESQR